MSASLDRVLAVLLAATGAAAAQANDVTRALDAGRWREAGQGLAAPAAWTGATLRRLAALPAPSLRAVLAGLRTRPSVPANMERVLAGFAASAAGDNAAATRALAPVLTDAKLGPLVVHVAGRNALQLCRRGKDAGRVVLARIAELWPAPWAQANLALGLRLLGRYDASLRVYHGLVARIGRPPWLLNDLGLLRDAVGESRRALELFLEGSRAQGQDDRADRDTCAGNAAILLLRRGEPGDEVLAEVLLAPIGRRDPTRVRTAYWLAQIGRPGPVLPSGRPRPARRHRVEEVEAGRRKR